MSIMDVMELRSFGMDIQDKHKEGLVLIDIFTEWCGPCKFVSPILEKLSEEGLFKLLAVDLDKNRPLGERFGISAIPTLLFFKNGKLLDKDITVNGQVLVRGGLMIGAAGEPILREIVAQT